MARLFDRTATEYLSNGNAVADVPFAMVCWFNSGDTSNQQILMGISEAGANVFHLLTYRGDYVANKLMAQSRQGVLREVATSTGYTGNTWAHACAIFAAPNDRRILLDNAGKGTDANAETPAGLDTTSLAVRVTISNQYPFDGRLAEAAIYDLSVWPGATNSDKADNFESIALPSLAAGYSPLFFPLGLMAYWSLIRDEDQDRVGGYDLTAFNAPSIGVHPPVIYPTALFVGKGAAAAGETLSVDRSATNLNNWIRGVKIVG